jgi:hypothetical protein
VTHAVVIQGEVDPTATPPITQLAEFAHPFMRSEAAGFERAIWMLDDGGQCIQMFLFDSKENAESWSSSKVTLDFPEETLGVYEILFDM